MKSLLTLFRIKSLVPTSLSALAVCLLMSACSATRFVGDDGLLLTSVKVSSDTKDINTKLFEPYVRQKANSKWFSLFKIPMGVYVLSGRDTSRWVNKVLQHIGEQPVVYDSVAAQQSCQNLTRLLQNMGYMNSSTTISSKRKGRKIRLNYQLHPGEPYVINLLEYDIQDEEIGRLLDANNTKKTSRLKEGSRFSIDALDAERKRITSVLLDNGYYRFHKDFIAFTADSSGGGKEVRLTLHLLPYKANNNAPETVHPRYKVRHVNYLPGNDDGHHLRQSVLEYNTAIRPGGFYSSSDLQKTYNNFGRLQAVKYTNIRFRETEDTLLLDANIQLTYNKPSTISFQPEGTNTSGDLGAAASVTYENRNLFRGAEVFSVQLRGAFEAITGLEGYQNEDYEEYSIESKLTFPRFVAPFLSYSFRRRSTARSELSIGYNLQNRPEFHRRVFSTAWRYHWSEPKHYLSYRFDLFDLNYVYMPWISTTFRHDYLDSEQSRNAILRYNYEDIFIFKIGFGMGYNDGTHVARLNVETAGNVLRGLSSLIKPKQNSEGQYTLFNIAYAQYVRLDLDFTKLYRFDDRNLLAMHAGMGIACPYGNSKILPFEKRYFSGGANSVRGWSVRELGPGKFKGTDGRIDFINQTGDMKLDLNLEYRTFLFWKFYGAAFIDAGNIWTLREYKDQPGGLFKFNEFYKQIAVGYGMGLRLNFDYFIIRMDAGMKAINPAYETHRQHYPITRHNMGRDFSFHFAVGLPF